MSLAALTPQVRTFLFCDEVIPDEAEEGVFTLRGVREQVVVDSFPHSRRVEVFLVLTYLRGGTFNGAVRLTQEETGDLVGEFAFRVAMDVDEGVAVPIELGPCTFLEPGRYNGELLFFGSAGQHFQKGQRSLLPIQRE